MRLCAKFCYRQELDEIKQARSVCISGWWGGFLSFPGLVDLAFSHLVAAVGRPVLCMAVQLHVYVHTGDSEYSCCCCRTVVSGILVVSGVKKHRGCVLLSVLLSVLLR